MTVPSSPDNPHLQSRCGALYEALRAEQTGRREGGKLDSLQKSKQPPHVSVVGIDMVPLRVMLALGAWDKKLELELGTGAAGN